MSYVLALDQGTTSSRAMLFDASGKVVSQVQRALSQSFPRPGWVEHDGHEILASQLGCARDALASAGVAAVDVAALGVTNQRETTLLWERATGRALAPAIVWQDRRTAADCDRLRGEGRADWIRAKTGLELDPYFSATKLAWLLSTVPGARARAECGELAFGTVDSWLVWHLSGGRLHVTDAGNASRTLLFNIHLGDWDDELLTCFGIPRALLPKVVDSIGICGVTDPSCLGAAVPIAAIAGDQQAATFGQACFAAGRAKSTYGTGCFMMLNTGAEPVASMHHLLTTTGWRSAAGTTFALEGGTFMGGALVQWLRDGLGLIRDSAEVEALAACVPDSGGVVLVPAFTGLGAPHWDAHARGLLIGLTRGTGRAHIARAALEAIALQVLDLVDAMRLDGARFDELRVDGGAAANDLLMQLQADLLGVPVIRPAMLETTAQGVAFMAGLAAGVWPDEAAVAALWREARRFEPALADATRDSLVSNWRRAVERCKAWEAE